MKSCFVVGYLTLLSAFQLIAQVKKPLITEFGKGVQFTSQDSTFTLSVGGRIQSMFESTIDRTNHTTASDFILRRCRLNIQGIAFNPKFNYRIQLGFAHGDIAASNSAVQNNLILRDAMFFYRANHWLRLGFGQTKLPGNRQRQISSANLQLVERSIANNNFTLDRDKGIWLYTNFKIHHSVIKNTIAVSSGEGRIISHRSGKLCYSARIEYLPFGNFANNSDYTESDQEREQRPRLSIAAAYSFNKSSPRTLGQLGEYLYNAQVSDITYYGADLFFKYRGLSIASELYTRESDQGIITNSSNTSQKNFVIAGTGFLFQSGYFLTKKDEIAMRFAQLSPNPIIQPLLTRQQEYVLGYSHYFSNHNLKIQTDLSYMDFKTIQNLIYRFSSVVTF